jgi:Tfp pilus assembly protein PilV
MCHYLNHIPNMRSYCFFNTMQIIFSKNHVNSLILFSFVWQMKGFTVIETIAAALIIAITLSSSLLVMEAVSSNYSTSAKSQSLLLLKSICESNIQKQDFDNESFEQGGLSIQKKIISYHSSKQLAIMVLEAKNNEKKIVATYQCLVLINK